MKNNKKKILFALTLFVSFPVRAMMLFRVENSNGALAAAVITCASQFPVLLIPVCFLLKRSLCKKKLLRENYEKKNYENVRLLQDAKKRLKKKSRLNLQKNYSALRVILPAWDKKFERHGTFWVTDQTPIASRSKVDTRLPGIFFRSNRWRTQ